MKYVVYISIIVVIFTAIAGITLFDGDEERSEKNCALRINDKMIGKEEFEKLYEHRPFHVADKKEFVQMLVGKELLIQEAQKLNLHQEDQFRLSVQSFYEQSLIRVLMDRKASSLKVAVAESDIDHYIDLLSRKIDFTIYEFDCVEKALKREPYISREENRDQPFQKLSMDIRYMVSITGEGEFSKPVLSSTDIDQAFYTVVHVEKISPIPGKETGSVDRDTIRAKLADYHKQQMITDWITDMRKKADVEVFAKL
ncbi:hypothetical protein KKI24_27360 [bacterium]|nr:hypothetical protein [bacterium]